MENAAMDNNSLPWRHGILVFLGLNWMLSAITGRSFLNTWGNYPSWFGPAFLLSILLLLSIVSFYIWQVFRTRTIKPPKRYMTVYIWTLVVVSVICTSALHKFYPFRLDIITHWPNIPPRHSILKYNFILTAGSLLSAIALSILYSLRYRRLALIGLIILAAIMLIPNDDCGNDFNRPWLRWIGISPLMFMPNSIVLLIGYCGLHGIWPRLGIILMTLINLCVLLLGLGHLTKVIW